MPVTLQFVAESDLTGRLISYYSHGWPCHVDVVWYPSLSGGPERLLGARQDGGVAIRANDYREFTRVARVTLPTTPEQDDKFHAFLIAQLGKPYDDLAILGFAVDRDWRLPDHWFCSELTTSATENCGFFRRIASPSGRVTPSDNLNLCSAFAEVDYVRGFAA